MRARNGWRHSAGDSPVLLKIAPDLSLTELDDVVSHWRARAGSTGMIVGKHHIGATLDLARAGPAQKEQGGIVGEVAVPAVDPDGGRKTYVARRGRISACRRRAASTAAAPRLTKIRAGGQPDPALFLADLQGAFHLVEDIKNDLASTLLRTGRDSLSENRRRGCGDDHRRGIGRSSAYPAKVDTGFAIRIRAKKKTLQTRRSCRRLAAV